MMKAVGAKQKFFFYLLSLAVIVFTTCKDTVGLGGAVDIVPPSVNAVYPPLNAVIRGTFMLKGTMSDDTGVKTVSVSISSPSVPQGIAARNASINADGTEWSIMLNNKRSDGTFEFPDGEYAITVAATDTAGKQINTETHFTIDNTAPVLVLDRPSTLSVGTAAAGSKADRFGDAFRIVGECADTSGVSEMKVYGYPTDSSGAIIGQPVVYTEKNVPPTVDIRVDSFAKPNGNQLLGGRANASPFYRPLYGDVDDKVTRSFYFDIEVYDKAYEYTGGAPVREGNKASVYYLRGPLYNGEVFPKHTVTDIYSMKSGLSVNNFEEQSKREAEKLRAKEIVEKLKNGSFPGTTPVTGEFKVGHITDLAAPLGNIGYFALNPSLNPTYQLIGASPEADTHTDFSAYPYINGGTLTVKIEPNFDDTPLEDVGEFKYYAIKASKYAAFIAAEPTYNEKKPGAVNQPPHYLDLSDPSYAVHELIAFENPQTEVRGSNRIVALKLDTTKFSPNEHYMLLVQGGDKDPNTVSGGSVVGNHIVPKPQNGKSLYGFQIATTGAPPALNTDVISEDSAKVSTGDTNLTGTIFINGTKVGTHLYIKGKASCEGNTATLDLKYILKKDGVALISSTQPDVVPAGNAGGPFEIRIPKATVTAEGQYHLTIIAKDTNLSKTTTRDYSLYIDSSAPFLTVKDIAENSTVNVLNKIGLTVMDSASGIKSGSFKAFRKYAKKDGELAAASRDEVTSSFDANYEWNGGFSEGWYVFDFEVEDNVGNKKMITGFKFAYDKEPPKIEKVGNIERPLLDQGAELNLAALPANLTGEITETNGVASVKIGSEDAALTGNNFNLASTLGEGRHKLKVVATDYAGRTDTVYVTLIIDTNVPVFKKLSVAESPLYDADPTDTTVVSSTSTTVKVVGKVQDLGSGVNKVFAEYQSNGTNKKVTLWAKPDPDEAVDSGIYLIDGVLDVGIDKQKITFTPYDKVGKQGLAWSVSVSVNITSLTLSFDITPTPSTPAGPGSVNVAGHLYVNKPFTLEAQAVQARDPSSSSPPPAPVGLEMTVNRNGEPFQTFAGFLTGKDPASLTSNGNHITGFQSDSGVQKVTFTPIVNHPHPHDGNYSFVYSKGGLTKTINVVIDTKPPAVTPISPQNGEKFTIDGNKEFAASVSDVCGIKDGTVQLHLRKKGAAGELAGFPKEMVSIAGSPYKISIVLPEEGEYEAWYTASDNLGNKVSTEDTPIGFVYDTEAPKFLYVKVAGSTNKSQTAKQGFSVNVEAKAEDAKNALKSLQIKVTKDGWTGEYSNDVDCSNLKTKEQTWTLDSTNLTGGDGTYTIRVIAKDDAGNVTVEDRVLIVDTAKPELTTPQHIDWINSDVVEVEGIKLLDSGTGISKLEYRIEKEDGSQIKDWGILSFNRKNTAIDWIGYVKGLKEGVNVVKYRATDNAGNETDVSTALSHTIRYDRQTPAVSIQEPQGSRATVKSGSALTLKVAADDPGASSNPVLGSGVKEVRYSTDPSADFASSTGIPLVSGVYETSIASITQDARYYIRAKDNAGNISSALQVDVIIDNAGPAVAFVLPAANTEVNKTVTVTGTARDDKGLKKVELQNPDGTVIGTFTGADVYSWSHSLDTVPYPDNADLTLKAVATDNVGNISEATLTIKVNQDTDRPKAAITNLDALSGKYLTGGNRLYGTVQDDDGPVKKLEISQDGGSNWDDVEVKSGSWKYVINAPDGPKTLKIRVTDAKDTVFSTEESLTLKRPQLYAQQIGAGTTAGTEASFMFDSVAPEFKSVEYSQQQDFSTAEVFGDDDHKKFGNTTIYLRIKAKDSAGVESVTVTNINTATNNEATVITAAAAGTYAPNEEETWVTPAIVLDKEAVKEVSIVITDKSGSKTTVKRSIIVDHTAPKAELLYPAEGNAQAGTIVISGAVSDEPASGASGVKAAGTKYMFVGKNGTAPTAATTAGWTAMGTSSIANWSVTCNLESLYPNADDYGQANAVTPAYRDLKLYVLTEDAVGNKAVKDFTIVYNPDGKKPVMQVLSPEAGAKVGGAIQIFGIGELKFGTIDDQRKVHIQFSTNGTFDSTHCAVNGHDWWNNGEGRLIPGTDSAGGGKQWRLEVNKTSGAGIEGWKLEHPTQETQDVWFRVRGYNHAHSVWGEWTNAVKITVDKTAPTIGSKTPMKVKYTAPAAERDYLPRMWIKSNGNLTGSLHDDSGIKELQILGDVNGGTAVDLTQALAKGWVEIDAAHAPTDPASTAKNYTLKLPLDFSGVSGKKEFEVTVRIVENTAQSKPSEKTFTFRFDETKPAGDFGTKLLSSYGLVNGNAVADAGLAAKLAGNTANKKLLIQDKPVSVTGINGSSVTFAPNVPVNGETVEYILYDQNQLVTSDGGINWNATGVAYDIGSGVEKVTVWLSVGGQETAHVVSTLTSTTDRITRELGSQYYWSANLDISSLPDGKGKLHYTIEDATGNKAENTSGVVVRNKYFKVAKIKLETQIGTKPLETDPLHAADDDPHLRVVRRDGPAKQKKIEGTTTNFAFKSLTASKIRLEFDGSNKGEGQVYVRIKSNAHAALSTAANGYAGADGNGFAPVTITGSAAEIPLTKKLLQTEGNSAVNSTSKITVELWDSAHGLAKGDEGIEGTMPKGTSFAKIIVDTIFDANDTQEPRVVIHPFHWNSETDNCISLLGNPPEYGAPRRGHVEIAPIAQLGNNHPSVSGSIRVHGFAYDNIKIDRLTAYIPYGQGGGNHSILTATKTGSSWTSNHTFHQNGLELKVEEIASDYSGTYLKWTLEWNTEKQAMAGNVSKDNTIQVKAYDGTNGGDESDEHFAAGEKKEGAVTRDGLRLAESAAVFADAKRGQFVSFMKDEQLYTTRIAKVLGGGKVRLEDNIDTSFTHARLYDFKANRTQVHVNVVPFITYINTDLTSADSGIKGAFSRASTGEYPVRAGDSIYVGGFNLPGGTVRLNGTTLGQMGPASIAERFNLSNTNTTGEVTVTVNGIPSVNNMVDTSKPYNMEANGINNNTLTVKRKLFVWKTEELIDNPSLESPQFVMAPNSDWYMSFGNLKTIGSGSNAMRLSSKIKKSGQTPVSSNQWDASYSKYQHTAIAYDTNGNPYLAAINTDRAGSSTSFALFFANPQNGNAYATNYGKHRLENCENKLTGVYDVDRVKIPKLAVQGGGTSGDKAKIALIYFDKNFDKTPVKFRYGYSTSYSSQQGGIKFDVDSGGDGSSPSDSGSAEGYEIIADSSSQYGSGAYAAVALTKSNRAIAVWYDAQNARLVYSFRDMGNSYSHAAQSNRRTAEWQTNAVEIDRAAPLYVDIALDSDENLHIGYYSSGEGGVKYAFLPANKVKGIGKPATSDFAKVQVDTYMNPGTLLKIGARKEGAKQVPYLTYYHNGFYGTARAARIAWLKGGIQSFTGLTDVKAGVKDRKFTGNWVVMTVPAKEGIQQYTICQGVPTGGAYADKVIAAYFTQKNYEMAVLTK